MNFSLPNVDGSTVSLDNYPNAKGFIIIFTCNHCPYAIAYEERIKALDERFTSQGFPVIAISSNDPVSYPQDSFENMKVRARDKEFGFPYLFDETQEIAKLYEAERTPHAYLLHKTDDGLKLVYKGSIDNNNNYKTPRPVTETWLADAVQKLINDGEAEYEETTAVGCTIKWKGMY